MSSRGGSDGDATSETLASDGGAAPTVAASGADATLAASSDVSATVGTVGPISGADATMNSGVDSSSPSRVTIRAGQASNYPGLVDVEPAHYAIGKEIARGGMGRIFTARDRRLGRTVAIKELLVASDELRVRFEREARITANLQHPAIVNILEAGTWPGGDPFYVMKLVTGESLDKVLESKRTVAERLGLLSNIITVVDALAYAHSKRVIHRDLKPHNILVGEFGETVVIDWGLAKDLSAAPTEPIASTSRRVPHDGESAPGETVDGAVMGTPAYMPIEQATAGDVNERADVYALGAILYHVLSGVAPYTAKSGIDILASVIAGPPVPITKRSPELPSDLVTIIDKAMARDAANRYPSANELAADLKKFQTGQLVGSHRYSRRELLIRWIAKHRAVVAISAIAVVVIATLTVLGIAQIIDERDVAQGERETARAERATAQAERAKAQTSRNRAEELLDFQLYDLRDKLEPVGKLDLLEAAAKNAVAYYAKEPPGATFLDRRRRGTALRNLSRVLSSQVDSAGSLEQAQAAVALFRALAIEQPDDIQIARDLCDSLLATADLYLKQSKPAESLAATTEAVERAHTLAKLHPDDSKVNGTLATVLNAGANQFSGRGETARAAELGTELLTLSARFSGIYPGDEVWQGHAALAHGWASTFRDREGDRAGSLREQLEAFAIRERLAKAHPDDVNRQFALAKAYDSLTHTYGVDNNYDAIVARTRLVIPLLERLVAINPTNRAFARQLATAHTTLGRAHFNLHQMKVALEQFRLGLAILEPIAARDRSNSQVMRQLALLRMSAGTTSNELGDLDAGAADLKAATDIYVRLVELNPTSQATKSQAATAFTNLGATLANKGDLAGEVAAHRKSVELWTAAAAKSTTAGNRVETGRAHWKLGDSLVKQKQVPEALVELRLGAETIQKELDADPKHKDGASIAWMAWSSLADALVLSGKRAEANVIYRRALELVDVALAADKADPDAAKAKPQITAKIR